jgi:hypothetical protein
LSISPGSRSAGRASGGRETAGTAGGRGPPGTASGSSFPRPSWGRWRWGTGRTSGRGGLKVNDMNHLEPYRTDHLLLLVGANPLPNYVAALLLSKKGGTIHLLNSKGTEEIKNLLEQAINNRDLDVNVVPHEVDEARGHRIYKATKQILEEIKKISPGKSIGLHYTGGTKAMSVHIHRAFKEEFPEGIASYLDARTISMVIDGTDEPIKLNRMNMDFNINLGELISLHGYLPPDINKTPFETDLYQEIISVYSEDKSLKDWRGWVQSGLNSLPENKYPRLNNFKSKLDEIFGGEATPESLANYLGYKQLPNCKIWLEGKWLEQYTLKSIADIAQKCQIASYSIDLMLNNNKDRAMQIDLAAVRGYQLFAISCKASKGKEACKEHLFEVYIRARQIGGDEARIGLICCYPDPAALQQEIKESWFTEGHVRIFGIKDLPELAARLEEWFDTANDSKTT